MSHFWPISLIRLVPLQESVLPDIFQVGLFDLIFVFTAIAFNLLVSALFIAQKKNRPGLTRIFGNTWLLLGVPLIIVFVSYWISDRDTSTIVYLSLVLLYMIIEFLLDYVMKIEFRKNWRLHVPYILLEYVALFSLIAIAFSIHPFWGYTVTAAFWLLMASLVYLYWGRKKKESAA